MKAHLRSKLQEVGWFDDINELALGRISGFFELISNYTDKLSTEETPKFDTVAESLEAQALCKQHYSHILIISLFCFTNFI